MIIDIKNKNKNEEIHIEIPEKIVSSIGKSMGEILYPIDLLSNEDDQSQKLDMNSIINNIISKYNNGEYDKYDEEYEEGEEEEYDEEEEEEEEDEEEEVGEEDNDNNKLIQEFDNFPLLKLDGKPIFMRSRSDSLDSKYIKYLSTIPKKEKNKLLKMEDDIMKEDESIIPLKARILTSNMNDVSKKIILEKLKL